MKLTEKSYLNAWEPSFSVDHPLPPTRTISNCRRHWNVITHSHITSFLNCYFATDKQKHWEKIETVQPQWKNTKNESQDATSGAFVYQNILYIILVKYWNVNIIGLQNLSKTNLNINAPKNEGDRLTFSKPVSFCGFDF